MRSATVTRKQAARRARMGPRRFQAHCRAWYISNGVFGLRNSGPRSLLLRADVDDWVDRLQYDPRWATDEVAWAVQSLARMTEETRIAVFPQIAWGCPMLAKERKKSQRAYAHSFHGSPNRICVHRAIRELPLEKIYGIITHEFGHINCRTGYPMGAEPEADQWVRDVLGIEILYDPGDTLEYLSPEDIRKLGKPRKPRT